MENLNVKSGSIQFWGEWFGGRPFENYHKVIEMYWDEEDILVIKLDQGEIVTIYNPINVILNEQEFSVEDASLITFEWFYYGREHTLENLQRLEYRNISDNQVLCTRAGTINQKLYKNGLFAMKIV